MAAAKITVDLDRPRAIAWGNLASYRLGTLVRPPSFSDLRNPRKSYSALVAFVWAMLIDGPEDFSGPEQLSEHIDPEKLTDFVRAVGSAIRRDASKNGNGSTNVPSPSSSSA